MAEVAVRNMLRSVGPNRSGTVRTNQEIVYVIDDDESVRQAMARLLRSTGLETRTFAGAEAFLKAACRVEKACVVADVCLLGMGGLELQRELIRIGSPLRVVFVSAYDMAIASGEMSDAGGVAFLIKPVDEVELLDAVHRALAAGA